MNIFNHINSWKSLAISLACALFIIYPNITWLPFELDFIPRSKQTNHIFFFFFRYFYYTGLIFILIKLNLEKIKELSFKIRFWKTFRIGVVAYVLFGIINFLVYTKMSHFGSLVLFQMFVICVLCALMGHIYLLYKDQRKKEQEIEQLKIENLQSRYDALTNQINPHFFFNSLNGLTALIRKKDDDKTLTYVNKMSDVFRYILQSDKKGLVRLEEELEFISAFRYMMEVRFANKLEFKLDIPQEALGYKLPVLSILPLIDNVVVHNRIDSEYKMTVTLSLNQNKELVVSNPIFPKLYSAETNGTGLQNLQNRFSLLLNKDIRVESTEVMFRVYLPLIE